MRAFSEEARHISFWPVIKIIIGFSLLFILIVRVNIDEVIDIFLNIKFLYLVLAFTFGLIAVALSAWRWQVILAVQGFSLTVKYLSLLVFKGLFFNNFLPGSIGGDAVRFLELGKRIKNNTASFSSILSERVLSSIALGLISLISGLLVFKAISEVFNWILFFSLACLVVFVLFIFTPRLFVNSSHGFIEKYKLKDVSGEILKIKNTKVVLQVIFLSLLFQFSLVVINWAIFLGLDVQINPVFYFLFIPITQAVSLIPLSFNGLGFREGSYIFLFGYVGLSQAVSLAAAISFFIIVTLLSLFGGAIFVLNK